MSAGGIVIAVVMILFLPVAVMLAGALWSFVFGALAIEDADRRGGTEAPGGEGAEERSLG